MAIRTLAQLKLCGLILRLHLYFRGLDMSRFTLGKDDKEGSIYDLFAVANHSGTVNFGHYTAFGRLTEADQPISVLKKDSFGEFYCAYCPRPFKPIVSLNKWPDCQVY